MSPPLRVQGAQEVSSEDALEAPLARMPDEQLQALLLPQEGRLVHGSGERLTRPADRHIRVGASLADLIAEHRR